jgi:hypothetical protein
MVMDHIKWIDESHDMHDNGSWHILGSPWIVNHKFRWSDIVGHIGFERGLVLEYTFGDFAVCPPDRNEGDLLCLKDPHMVPCWSMNLHATSLAV